MSKFAVMSGLTGAGAVGAVAVAVATGVIDLETLRGGASEPAPASEVQAALPQPAPAEQLAIAQPAPSSSAAPEAPEAPVETAPAPVMPRFDLVRAEADGMVLVAGQTEPGAEVTVLVDAALEGEARSGGDGKFVMFLDLLIDRPRVLTLRARIGDLVLESEEEIILTPPVVADATGPSADPVETAEAEPEAVPDPVEIAEVEPKALPDPVETADAEPETRVQPVETAALEVAPQPQPPVGEGPETEAALAASLAGTSDQTHDAQASPEPIETASAPETALDGVPQTPTSQPAPQAEAVALADLETVAEPPVTPQTLPAPDMATAPAKTQSAGQGQPAALADDAAAAPAPSVEIASPVTPKAETSGGSTLDPGSVATGTAEQVASGPAPRAVAPAVIRSGPRGIDVLPAAPLAPGSVALDAISYDAQGAVRLAGRGGEAGFVRVYLDNAPLTVAQVEETGQWRVTLPDVDTGTYTLRVDQIAEDGSVTARVESPFLRESPENLARAAEARQGPISSVTVQPGNTLWAIARTRYGEGVEYVKVFEANRDRIRNPDLIYPGQIFDLPQE